MILLILITFISLISLVVLHEFGHFILAKKFGVRVDEFGIGYPPRLWSKKIGETLYSLNLLPFGAFVQMPGEIGQTEDRRSFSRQPVSKRAIIAFGGVLSFWLMAVAIFSVVFYLGAPIAVSDEADSNLINPKIQITAISAGSPAEVSGLKAGDAILNVKYQMLNVKTDKIKEVVELTNTYRGQEIVLTIQRGKEIFDVKVVPRVSPPSGEGPLGVSLVRTAIKSYPLYSAPWQGITATVNLTISIIDGYTQAIKNLFKGAPSGVQLVGPVGIFHLLTQAGTLGINYFLQFIGIIAIYLAIFNILPIPSVDGGKLLFLGVEAIRKRPISEEFEQKITTAFFMMLIALAIFVTIKDIGRIL